MDFSQMTEIQQILFCVGLGGMAGTGIALILSYLPRKSAPASGKHTG